MRAITVTGGNSGAAEVDLTDRLGTLNEATIRTLLVEENGDEPASNDPGWSNPYVNGTPVRVLVSTLVDTTTTPGRYNLAIQLVQDGRYEVVWAVDSKRRSRRAVIEVK